MWIKANKRTSKVADEESLSTLSTAMLSESSSHSISPKSKKSPKSKRRQEKTEKNKMELALVKEVLFNLSEAATLVPKSKGELEADSLIQEILEAIQMQMQHQEELKKDMLNEESLLLARKASGNDFGASMCYKKLRRSIFELSKSINAVTFLENHVMEIECQIDAARAGLSLSGSMYIDGIDIQSHKDYAEGVNLILSAPFEAHQAAEVTV